MAFINIYWLKVNNSNMKKSFLANLFLQRKNLHPYVNTHKSQSSNQYTSTMYAILKLCLKVSLNTVIK
jgi:hypothetical protein